MTVWKWVKMGMMGFDDGVEMGFYDGVEMGFDNVIEMGRDGF